MYKIIVADTCSASRPSCCSLKNLVLAGSAPAELGGFATQIFKHVVFSYAATFVVILCFHKGGRVQGCVELRCITEKFFKAFAQMCNGRAGSSASESVN